MHQDEIKLDAIIPASTLMFNITTRIGDLRVLGTGMITFHQGQEFVVEVARGEAVPLKFQFLIREPAAGEGPSFTVHSSEDTPDTAQITMVAVPGIGQGGMVEPIAVAKFDKDVLRLSLVVSKVMDYYIVQYTWYLQHEAPPSQAEMPEVEPEPKHSEEQDGGGG